MRFAAHYHTTYIPELDGSGSQFYDHLFEQMELLDRLGYDDVWVTEHHFSEYGGMIPHPPTFLSAIARTTHQIHLGTAVAVLPVQNPIQAAEAYAMVDVVSHGRLEFGVGRGNNKFESDAFGFDYDTSPERMRHGTEVMLRAWSEGAVDWQGREDHYDQLRILPRVVQHPHPPVWVGASRSEDSYRWAGLNGFHLMVLPYLIPPDVLLPRIQIWRDALAEGSHDPATHELLGKFHVYVGESPEAVRREAVPYYDNYRRISAAHLGRSLNLEREPIEEMIAKGDMIAGTPKQCIEHIQRWHDLLGITCLSGTVHFGGMPHELALQNINLFASEVMPAFDRTVAARMPVLSEK
ncbi:MAG TPA: LLM class flavin-dependent oxidoreductase [Chloroflexota bacterium]